MHLDDQITTEIRRNPAHAEIGWAYMNLCTLIFIALWTLFSLMAIYYLWYAFNLFQIEVQDITFEIIDFRTSDIETKPREIFRLINLEDDVPSGLAPLTV
jgi:hypothetical protein